MSVFMAGLCRYCLRLIPNTRGHQCVCVREIPVPGLLLVRIPDGSHVRYAAGLRFPHDKVSYLIVAYVTSSLGAPPRHSEHCTPPLYPHQTTTRQTTDLRFASHEISFYPSCPSYTTHPRQRRS